MHRTRGELEFKQPKTKTSRRTITLPAVTVEALQAHYKAHLEDRMKLGLGRDPRGLVFTRGDGLPLDPDSLSKAFERLILKAKVTPITLHGLRHTHIRHVLMDCIHVKVVSERAGHANVNITLNTYAAYIPNMRRRTRRCASTLGCGEPVRSQNSWVRIGWKIGFSELAVKQ